MTVRLAGRVVATTRDGDPDDALARALAVEGARVLVWPTLSFQGPADPGALRAALEDGPSYDWVVFTSARAVQASTPLPDRGGSSPKVAAVGEATARALADAGWPADVVGAADGARGLAEAMERSAPLGGVRVLFPAGSLARDVLEVELAARGAFVMRVEAYRALPVPPDAEWVRADLARGVHAVAFASPSAVHALGEALSGDLAGALEACGIAAIGTTTAAALRDKGVTRITVASEASVQGLVDACVRATSEN